MDQMQPGPPMPPGPLPTPRPQPGAWAPPPMYGAPGAPYGYGYAAPPPQVIQVRCGRGGFARAVGFVIGLLVIGAIFVIGIVVGAGSMLASPVVKPVLLEQEFRDGDDAQIAIIPVRGVIDDQQARFVRTAVDKVLKDRKARAVILRVDSPGGAIAPSDQIWHDVGRLKKARIPLVASFGGLAASGGYYVSCSADHILAEETSITGSIGVIAQTFVVHDMLGKIGVEPKTLIASNSPNKDVGNPFREWTPEDRDRIMTHLDAAYATFVARVSAGRAKLAADSQRLAALADGSIFTAAQALENGLVDAIGYLDDAVAEAEKRANIPQGRAHVIVLRQPPPLFGPAMFLRGDQPERAAAALDADAIRGLVNDLTSLRVMYLMP